MGECRLSLRTKSTPALYLSGLTFSGGCLFLADSPHDNMMAAMAPGITGTRQ